MNHKIHRLQLGYSNAFCIETANGLVLIDTGLKNNLKTIAKQLQKNGLELSMIKIILITHAHPDHIGSLAELANATNAEIRAHKIEAKIMRGEELIQNAKPDSLSLLDRSIQALAPNVKRLDLRVDRELEDSVILDGILDGFEVVHLPGHTMGQIGFWHPDSKSLIGGDVMMNIANRLTMPLRAFSTDWEKAKESVAKVANMKPNNLYLGHGSPILGNAEQPLKRLVDRVSNN